VFLTVTTNDRGVDTRCVAASTRETKGVPWPAC
jgi:hypothetical protein